MFDSTHSGLVDWHSYAIEFLLITSIIVSLISAFYYLRLIKIASIKDEIIIRGGRSSEGEYIALGVVICLTI